jgi:hypothetical protein
MFFIRIRQSLKLTECSFTFSFCLLIIESSKEMLFTIMIEFIKRTFEEYKQSALYKEAERSFTHQF